MPRKPMSREFRKRLVRNAAVFFLGLLLALMLLVFVLDSKKFMIAALVMIPVAALTFNLMMRRAYAAEIAGKR